MWDQEPKFLCWKVQTWEHAALVPTSFGQTARVRDSQRLLPKEITAEIYAFLAAVEGDIFRLTEPLPPFEARLLREDNISFGHEFFRKRFSEVVPDWEQKVTDALGESLPDIQRRIRHFATLGIPRDNSWISYGYRIDSYVIEGRHADPRIETHRSLLMDCPVNPFQPGIRRNSFDSMTS